MNASIKNFRSLKGISIQFGAHTALIGGNGAGKSSILKAIEKFYSSSRTLDVDDFFGRDQSESVEIELTFSQLTDQETTAFESRVRDGQLVVTRVFDGTSSSGRYYGSVLQNPDFVQIRAQQTANPRREAYRELKTKPAYADLPVAASASAVDQAMLVWEAANPDKLKLQRDDGQFFGFQNASRGALQRYTTFVFIPAVREASIDASDGKSSVIGRLLELVVRSAILQRQDIINFKNEMSAKYQALVTAENMPELGQLASKLTKDLKGLYRDAEVGLSWREISDFPVPLPVADLSLSDDGFGGPVDRQGHGLQRAFIFTLLQHLARTSTEVAGENIIEHEQADAAKASPPAPSLILAIEEPELYQHPTKQRHFAEVLRGLSSGTLPGAESPTQIMFASHSPMFVSLAKADEIRLVRRTDCDGSEYKQCEMKALDLSVIAQKLELGWDKPKGSYSAATLIPRLHILGTELAEGFFANGVVLVEGRSDRAALSAAARLFGVSFEAAGIAILSAEGKENLDRPLVIFRELGIPTFVIWDCDSHRKEKDGKFETNYALRRLSKNSEFIDSTLSETSVEDCYAHFGMTLEHTLIDEIGTDKHRDCLSAACIPFGLTPNKDTHKIPEVMFQTLTEAKKIGIDCPTLLKLVRAIWLHLRGEHLSLISTIV